MPRFALEVFAICESVSVERDRLFYQPVSMPIAAGPLPVELGDEVNLAVVVGMRRRRRLAAPLVLRLIDPSGEETPLYLREGKYGHSEQGLIVELAGYTLRRHGRYRVAIGLEAEPSIAEASFVVTQAD